MKPDQDPQEEGHAREWQDRARVVLDAKEAVQHTSADKQSPAQPASMQQEDVEEKSEELEKRKQRTDENY